MLGSLFMALVGVVRRPRSLRITSLVYQLYKVGFQAIPIMVLITFPDRRHHRAAGTSFTSGSSAPNSYTVDMVGILVLPNSVS